MSVIGRATEPRVFVITAVSMVTRERLRCRAERYSTVHQNGVARKRNKTDERKGIICMLNQLKTMDYSHSYFKFE